MFMASTAIYHALSTVSTTRVTYWMEPVLAANLGGQGQIVTQVWEFITFIMIELWTFTKVMQINIDQVN